jgi:hypothetical protein
MQQLVRMFSITEIFFYIRFTIYLLMKKLLVLLSFALALNCSLWAQPCTPNPAIGSGLMHPDTLPFAMVGYKYYQVLTFRVPKDSTLVYNGFPVQATVDSARLIFMGGIPPGFSYECTPASCTWRGGTLGCATFFGRTDSPSVAGKYPIKIYIQSWIKAAGTDFIRVDSSSNYNFRVLAYNGGIEIEKAQTLKVYPNPAKHFVKVDLENLQSELSTLEMLDMQGKAVYKKVFDKPADYYITEEIAIGSFSPGLYIIRLSTGDKIALNKILVE